MESTPETHAPIYQRLFERFREDITAFRLPPGAQIDSITELQSKYRVGRETAKRVLGMLADEGYIVQLRGKGSFVADLRPRQKVWGLIFPFYSIQYEELITEITGHATAHGRTLQHFCNYNSYEEEIRLVSKMLRERYEAVVVIPTLDESKTWNSFYSRLPTAESSVVLLDHTMISSDFRFVVQSYDLGVTRALQYLLEQKPGGVAFVENELWAGRNMVLELMRGTCLEHLRVNRPDPPPLLLSRASLIHADLLRRHGITGVFCCDDTSAIQVIGQLREQGMPIPGEVNVVSYGNTGLARYFSPPITSVDPHNREMASILSDLLTGNNRKPSERQFVVQPELIVRGT
ncbi:MAG: substrate-binding domain-containing protein [Candidatus Hydrogenedentes bacterium]|nr:substrate-binding domain-containing protein [Candidatus Hydrogenedentota bacterium]